MEPEAASKDPPGSGIGVVTRQRGDMFGTAPCKGRGGLLPRRGITPGAASLRHA